MDDESKCTCIRTTINGRVSYAWWTIMEFKGTHARNKAIGKSTKRQSWVTPRCPLCASLRLERNRFLERGLFRDTKSIDPFHWPNYWPDGSIAAASRRSSRPCKLASLRASPRSAIRSVSSLLLANEANRGRIFRLVSRDKQNNWRNMYVSLTSIEITALKCKGRCNSDSRQCKMLGYEQCTVDGIAHPHSFFRRQFLEPPSLLNDQLRSQQVGQLREH